MTQLEMMKNALSLIKQAHENRTMWSHDRVQTNISIAESWMRLATVSSVMQAAKVSK